MNAFNDDPPFDLPPPRELADALMARAWDEDTPDRERLLLEQGARVIEHLLARLAMATDRGIGGAEWRQRFMGVAQGLIAHCDTTRIVAEAMTKAAKMLEEIKSGVAGMLDDAHTEEIDGLFNAGDEKPEG